jgi:membrane protein implicated in regulation of membrane protease activity
MNNNITRKIILRYFFFQLPAFILLLLILLIVNKYTNTQIFIFIIIAIVWILKDIIMFPFTWRSYDTDLKHFMVGREGMANESLNSHGYVRIGNELWKAEADNNNSKIQKGNKIVVLEAEGLKLIVKKID